MAGGFSGSIGTASDFQIFKFAVDTGKTKVQIAKIEADLRKLRAEANATVASARGARAAVRRNRITRVPRAGFNANSAEIEGIGSISKNGFTLSGGFMRSATGLIVALGTAVAAEHLVSAYHRFRTQEALLGPEEARARLGGSVLRGAFRFTTGGEGGRAISRLAGSAIGGLDSDTVNMRIRQFERYLFETKGQDTERKERAKLARAKVEEQANAFENREYAFINEWRPSNVQLRSSQDVAVLKRSMWDRNGGAIAADVKKNRATLEAKLKQELAKD